MKDFNKKSSHTAEKVCLLFTAFLIAVSVSGSRASSAGLAGQDMSGMNMSKPRPRTTTRKKKTVAQSKKTARTRTVRHTKGSKKESMKGMKMGSSMTPSAP